jgi:hypothetical protein
MLNDADGHGGGEAREKLNDAGSVVWPPETAGKGRLQQQGPSQLAPRGPGDFEFEAGEQLNDEDKVILQDAKRPIVIFNRVRTTSIASPVMKSATDRRCSSCRAGSAWQKRMSF